MSANQEDRGLGMLGAVAVIGTIEVSIFAIAAWVLL